MMTNRYSRSLLALLITAAGPAAQAQSEQEALRVLDSLLAGIETMTANVSQLIVESDGGVLEESQIRMKIKRPEGFYWETVDPFPELIVTDGTFLWNYQPDLEQVVVENWDASRSELAAQILSGNTANLTDEYTIELRDSDSERFTEFELEPLEADNVYRQITLTFDGGLLDMIFVDNDNGQKTVWQFQDVVLNTSLPDSDFIFVPTGDIEVIENTYVE